MASGRRRRGKTIRVNLNHGRMMALKFTIKINGDKDYDLKNPGVDEKTARNYSMPGQR